MSDHLKKVRIVSLAVMLVAALYLSFASIRLSRMCDFWDYYNYPHLNYGSQITFSELSRYSLWWERAPDYSWSGCLSELRQVDGAIQQWALEHNKTPEDKPTWKDLKPYFGYADANHPSPRCPYGGRYILGKVKEGPRCTVSGHIPPQ